MRPLRALVFTLLTFSVLAIAQTAPPPVSLPVVTAYALDRAKVTLPAAFDAPFNLLILYFERDQEPAANGWLPVTETHVQGWRLPVSQRENGVYRWWMNASLRGDLAYDQRRYTVPLYVDKKQFLGSLQISSEQDVAVLLTDRSGRVLWRSSGPATDSKKSALANFLKTAPH